MKLLRAPLALGVGLLFVSGCDYPTEPPDSLEQQWILPFESTAFGVDELLPDGVRIVGGSFVLTIDQFFTSASLGGLCPSCVPLDGVTQPAPGFTAQFSVTETLPTDVTGATLSGGIVQIAVRNGFSFDPIQFPSGPTGTVTISVTDGPGGTLLGQVVIDGATEAFPPGQTVNKTMTLATGDVGETFVAVVDIVSPSSTDNITIDTSESITLTATPVGVQASSADVDVSNLTVTLDPVPLDVDDIEDSILDEITHGALILEIANPFGVSVTGTLVIGSATDSVTKPLIIPASPTSTVTIPYTGDELRTFLGKPDVSWTSSGTVSSQGPITVTPTQEATIDGNIALTLLFG